MAHKVLITMEDLEAAVRINAAFEAAGERTTMVSAGSRPMSGVN